MTALEAELRAAIREIVRDELKRALADHAHPDEYLSTDAAAKLADVHPDTIRRWIAEGRLGRHKAGRELRIVRAELERLLAVAPRDDHELTPEEMAVRDFG